MLERKERVIRKRSTVCSWLLEWDVSGSFLVVEAFEGVAWNFQGKFVSTETPHWMSCVSAQVSQQDEGCRREELGFRGVVGDACFHEELSPVVRTFRER